MICLWQNTILVYLETSSLYVISFSNLFVATWYKDNKHIIYPSLSWMLIFILTDLKIFTPRLEMTRKGVLKKEFWPRLIVINPFYS